MSGLVTLVTRLLLIEFFGLTHVIWVGWHELTAKRHGSRH